MNTVRAKTMHVQTQQSKKIEKDSKNQQCYTRGQQTELRNNLTRIEGEEVEINGKIKKLI